MEVRDNAEEHRYELFDDDELIGFTVYKERDDRIWFVHTEIDVEHQGTGAGSLLVRRAMDDMRARDAKIVPTCPFVAAWIRSHPEYEDLVDTETLREYKRARGRRVPPGSTVSEPCGHLPEELGQRITPWPLDGCAECLAAGGRDWVHLRLCHYCGHVGCCDNSPGRHGSAHAALTGHPLIRSYERDENWWYCYVDERLFDVADAPPAPSASQPHRGHRG